MQPGSGKRQPLSEPVLTPSGWVPIGSLNVGDYVIGSDGLPTKVLGVYDQGVHEGIQLTFRDGAQVRCDPEHLWTVHRTHKQGIKSITLTTQEWISKPDRYRYYLPTVKPVQHAVKDLPIDPYLLGALVADGYLPRRGQPVYRKNEQGVINEVGQAAKRSGFNMKEKTYENSTARGFVFHSDRFGDLSGRLRGLGLKVPSAQKFIPVEYMTSSEVQRRSLLAGLFDGDGRVRRDRGYAVYSTMSYRLATDVRALCWSLGMQSTLMEHAHRKGNYWQVSVFGDTSLFRASKWASQVSGGTRAVRRTVKSVETTPAEAMRCIRVAAEDSLYVTRDYVVTHNTVLSVEAAHRYGTQVNLVVAPLQTHDEAWRRTIRLQTGQEARKVGGGTKTEKANLVAMEAREPGWYLATPQWFSRANITDWDLDLAIIDEVHELANPGKVGAKKLAGAVSGDNSGSLSVRAKHKLALSGTPARNKFEYLWTVMRFLWPDNLNIQRPNYYAWVAEHMLHSRIFTGMKTNPRTGRKAPSYAKKPVRERNPGALFRMAPCVIQHFRREQCCEYHPNGFLSMQEPQVVKHQVDLTKNQKRAIKELETQYLTWLDDNPLIVELPMTMQQRIRQLTLGEATFDDEGNVNFTAEGASPFADELERILEQLDENEPVVVFMDSQRFARALTERLNNAGYSAFEYSGGVSKKQRAEDILLFGDKYQVCVGVLSSLGTGTDGLQRVAKTEVWFESSLDETVNEQARGRLDRMGGRDQVQRFILLDDEGRAEGRLGKQLQARLALNASTRKQVELDNAA